MKCPKCGKDLMLVGEVEVEVGVPLGEKIKPEVIRKTYACVNTKCDNYNKSFSFDFDARTGKLIP